MRNNLLLQTILILITGSSAFGQSNLAVNGAFEQGSGIGWSLDAGGGSDVTYTTVSDAVQEGDSCLQAEVRVLGESSWSVQIKNAFGPVVEGSTYVASIWAKSATAGSTINFTIGKATSDYKEYATAYGLALTNEWVKYSVQFTSEVSTSDDITLALHITSEDTYWFDNFQVVEYVQEPIPASVNAYGARVTLTLSNNFTPITADDQLPFFIHTNEREYAIKNIIMSSDARSIILITEERIRKGEVVTLEYIPGTLRTSAGVEIEASIFEVENNSTYVYVPPVDEIADVGESSDILVYPTEVSDKLVVKSDSESLQKITIFNAMGSAILELPAYENKVSFGLPELTKGIYFVEAKTMSETKIVKIIKK